MPKKQNENKPIAVITESVTAAIEAICALHDIREVNGAKRRLIRTDGQIFYIVTRAQHLDGLEISDYIIIPGAKSNPDFDLIYRLAKLRMR